MASSTKKLICFLVVVTCVSFSPSLANAHEGLHEQIAAVTAKIKRDGRNAKLYLQRGELHRLHRDWTRAVVDYNMAARLAPTLAIVDLARGKMLFESGRLTEAKLVLDRFLRKQPNHLEGMVTRARVAGRIGDRLQAVQDFTQAITLAPVSEPELYLERAQTLAQDAATTAEALRGLDEGIKRLGPIVTLQSLAIDFELRLNNYDGALARLDSISQQSERKEMWLVRRGEILNSAGRREEARAAFNAALVAIESLPPERRQNRAVTALQQRALSGLQ